MRRAPLLRSTATRRLARTAFGLAALSGLAACGDIKMGDIRADAPSSTVPEASTTTAPPPGGTTGSAPPPSPTVPGQFHILNRPSDFIVGGLTEVAVVIDAGGNVQLQSSGPCVVTSSGAQGTTFEWNVTSPKPGNCELEITQGPDGSHSAGVPLRYAVTVGAAPLNGPMLSIELRALRPGTACPGKLLTGEAIVGNSGDQPSETAKLTLTLVADPTVSASVDIPTIEPHGGVFTATFDVRCAHAAQCANVTRPSQAEWRAELTNATAPVVTTTVNLPGARCVYADLVVVEIVSCADRSCHVSAVISNQGIADSGDFNVGLSINGTPRAPVSMSLRAGERRPVDLGSAESCISDSCKLTVTADLLNEVDELDEHNNSKTSSNSPPR